MNFSNAFPNGGNGGIGGFDSAEAAPEFTPLPPGVYEARVAKGEYCSTKAGADAFRMRFEVTGGPHTGRTVIRTWTFSTKALPYTKRDLAAFGLTTTAQLRSPFPEPGKEYRVRLVVALQQGNDGITRNDIKKFDIISVTDSPAGSAPESPADQFRLPPMSL